jgi:hypothetical protein
MRNRLGAGTAYAPRFALQGLGQDDSLDESDFGDTSDLTTTDLSLPADTASTDIAASVADTGTYDSTTGQVVDAGSASGVAGVFSTLGTALSTLFGGPSKTQINATGTSLDDGVSSTVPMLLLLLIGGGVLYMALQDRD